MKRMWLSGVIFALFLLWGCKMENSVGSAGIMAESSSSQTTSETPEESDTATSLQQQEASSAPSEAERIRQRVADMTTEEKIGQLLLCDPDMLCNQSETRETSDVLIQNIKKYKLSGFIFFKNNLVSPDGTTEFIKALQQASDTGLFISVDEEGGIVSRIGSNPTMNFKKQPTMKSIGETKDPEKAYQVGTELGTGLKEFGFNMDFAPVADVNTNPKNPVIGSRAFGSDPGLVAEMVAKEVKGLQDQNVSAVIKHFPGHGDTSSDTHTGAVSVSHDLARLRSVELVPFAAGIKAGADAVMISHIAVPNVTGNDLPSSISPEIVTGLLREEMGFDGLVVTDSLSMGAVSKNYELPEYCVKSINAGCDLLLLHGDPAKGDMITQFDGVYQALLTAAKDGTISKERLDSAVNHVLTVKVKRNIG